jgi:thiamine-phosphate diphosphorylase
MTAPLRPPALPGLLVLTDRLQLPAGRSLVEQVARCVAGGARAVVLREKDLPRPERAALAEALAPVVRGAGGTLLAASDPTLAADGVHLAAADPRPAEVDSPTGAVGPVVLTGRSCHSLADLRAAAAEGATYATLSPIHATASKPGYGPALGLEGLTTAIADLGGGAGPPPMPVYALGGIDSPARATRCRAAGAAGVAVMGALMRADDPTALAAELVAATTPTPVPT